MNGKDSKVKCKKRLKNMRSTGYIHLLCFTEIFLKMSL